MPESTSLLIAHLSGGGLLLGVGLLCVWLARRGERGLLKPNQIAGVRTRLTLSNDVAWYAAQTAAAPNTRIAGWGAVVGSAVMGALALWGQPGDSMIFVALPLAIAGWLLAWVIAGGVVAQRAARKAWSDAYSPGRPTNSSIDR